MNHFCPWWNLHRSQTKGARTKIERPRKSSFERLAIAPSFALDPKPWTNVNGLTSKNSLYTKTKTSINRWSSSSLFSFLFSPHHSGMFAELWMFQHSIQVLLKSFLKTREEVFSFQERERRRSHASFFDGGWIDEGKTIVLGGKTRFTEQWIVFFFFFVVLLLLLRETRPSKKTTKFVNDEEDLSRRDLFRELIDLPVSLST